MLNLCYVQVHDPTTPPTTVLPTLEPECTESDLRLTNSTVKVIQDSVVYEGNTEVCFQGRFVVVCDEGWDDFDACNHLGCASPIG